MSIEERHLQKRADRITDELRRRRSTSAIQAEAAVVGDNREPIEERSVEELSTSELQARARPRASAYRARAWEEVK